MPQWAEQAWKYAVVHSQNQIFNDFFGYLSSNHSWLGACRKAKPRKVYLPWWSRVNGRPGRRRPAPHHGLRSRKRGRVGRCAGAPRRAARAARPARTGRGARGQACPGGAPLDSATTEQVGCWCGKNPTINRIIATLTLLRKREPCLVRSNLLP